MKKVLSLVLALAMVLGSFGFTFAAAPTATVNEAGEILRDLGVLEGYQGDLNLEGPLKRQDMIVLLSRLLGVEDEAKSFPLPTTFTDVKGDFYPPYIAWAQSQGLVEGMGNGLFGYDDQLTVKHLVTFLLRALGHEGQEAWNMADAAAADFTSAALNSQATRGVMAQATVAALSMEVAEGGMTLGTKLGFEGYEIEEPTPEKLEVVSVSATNLKEVEVKFNQPVDRVTAERTANYTLKRGNETVQINHVVLSENGEVATLTVQGNMTNQANHTLTVRRAVAGDLVINNVEKTFAPLDITVPTVVSVDSLGLRAVRVTFSEPMSDVKISNFKINGNAVSGSLEAHGDRTVIVRPFVDLAEGTHTLEVSGAKDYATLQVIKTEINFDAVKDTVAPAVASVVATPETVTVKFTEPVQRASVRGGSSVYWKATTTTTQKNNADFTFDIIADDTVRFDFKEANLPLHQVYLYIEGVRDYSDNVIDKDAYTTVTANLDETRPIVIEVELNKTNDAIDVEFSKEIGNIDSKARYTLLDKDGKEVAIKDIVSSKGGTVATIEFFSTLSQGTYTFRMNGLADTTVLKNTILPYETTLEVGKTTAPYIVGVSMAQAERQIFIQFSEAMTLTGEASVLRAENYFIMYKGVIRALPNGTNITLADNAAKSVIITLPARIDNADFVASDLTEITVQRVEDIHGNIIKGFSENKNFATPMTFGLIEGDKNAELTGKRTVTVEFNRSITPSTVRRNDFVVTSTNVDGIEVVNYEVNGSKVTLTLNKDVYGQVAVNVLGGNIKSVIGETFAGATVATAYDKVAPEMKSVTRLDEKTIDIEFHETVSVLNEDSVKFDLHVRVNNEKLNRNEFSVTAVGGNKIRVAITKPNFVSNNVSVELESGRMISDSNNNAAVAFRQTAALGVFFNGITANATVDSVTVDFGDISMASAPVASDFSATVNGTQLTLKDFAWENNVATFAITELTETTTVSVRYRGAVIDNVEVNVTP
ncbi:S-layer homology domain-containing protein [Alkaliphilus transvaalensis]|uniref:S-layer homology domain-containing protein n=1 Tax=Alkaliphilus transvaalensis TaxID=114628 RepID=UPI00047AB058|nr:S-layer homology domain-containing protein [Alkaliphilus transvaalensis]